MRGVTSASHRALLACLIAITFGSFLSVPPVSARSSLPSRQKPGPVTLRGVASHVRTGGFTLDTRTRGSYTVVTTSATTVVEKGKSGKLSVHEGDHVGVRGFVQGRQLNAISVRIYPVKPKAYSIRGTISSIKGSELVIASGGKSVRVRVTGQTSIRVGNSSGTIGQVRVGDRVEARLQPGSPEATALHIHVYQSKVTGKHVVLRGTVSAVTSGAIVVKAGTSTYRVAVSGQTIVYLGSAHASLRSLKPGLDVTVYACCAGQPLAARSIHVRAQRAQRVTRATILLRGSVSSMSASQLQVTVSGRSLTVTLEASTLYELGSSPIARTGVHLGDQVSVRVYRSCSTLVALRVHVYPSSRRAHTVTGVVAVVTKSGLVVDARGKRYSVGVGRGARIAINGKSAPLSSIRTGDHVHVVGSLSNGALVASEITVRRAVPKQQTIRGTVVQVNGSTLIVADSSGARRQVRLPSGQQVLLHGKPAPAAALFVGVGVTARGVMSGNVLLASRVSLTVRTKSAKGRVVSVGRNSLLMQLISGQSVHVDLPAGLAVADPAVHSRRASIQVGAYIEVHGYVEQSGAIRAVSVQVLHPSLDVSAVVVGTIPQLTIQTTRGDRYRLRFAGSAAVTVSRVGIALAPADIPNGARIHVQGTVESDGSLLANEAVVRLRSATAQGTIAAVSKQEMTVQTDSGTVRARILSGTTFAQGSHALTESDLVIGDDVSISGYSAASNTILARKVLVHRKLTALDGTVASLTSDGFTLTAADGTYRVIMSTSTIVTGGAPTDIASGLTVHVTGYRRGDGVILATRVRLGTKR